jgi:hypothetical protein
MVGRACIVLYIGLCGLLAWAASTHGETTAVAAGYGDWTSAFGSEAECAVRYVAGCPKPYDPAELLATYPLTVAGVLQGVLELLVYVALVVGVTYFGVRVWGRDGDVSG